MQNRGHASVFADLIGNHLLLDAQKPWGPPSPSNHHNDPQQRHYQLAAPSVRDAELAVARGAQRCLLSGVKRTSQQLSTMSAYDPKRTSMGDIPCHLPALYVTLSGSLNVISPVANP